MVIKIVITLWVLCGLVGTYYCLRDADNIRDEASSNPYTREAISLAPLAAFVGAVFGPLWWWGAKTIFGWSEERRIARESKREGVEL